jgi:drug/metabolite transporter (DMT)-like permease
LFRVIVGILIATLSAAVGQILLRKGMQVMGPLESYAPLHVVSYMLQALFQPYVILGTVLSAVFYFCMLAVLSWTGVTVAIPLTAIEYAFATVLAVAVLKEAVPPVRWAGIACVIIGVILISAGGGEDPVGQGSKQVNPNIEGSTHLE